MAVEFKTGRSKDTIQIIVSGRLTKEDYARFVPEMERLIRENGKIRILFEMRNFHGWSAGALWEDVKFDYRHFRDIERLAIVGDKRWQKAMAMFCKPFTTAKIHHFGSGRLAKAEAWLEKQNEPAKAAV